VVAVVAAATNRSEAHANTMMIRTSGLTLRRGARTVLASVNFELHRGELLGVLGANGAGKSTLVAALAGELAPQSGAITLDGVPLDQLDARAQARLRAVMTQQAGLSFDLAVDELVAMGAYPFERASAEQVRSWREEALAQADLSAMGQRMFSEISGGEQRLAQFARAIVQCLAAVAAQGHAYLLLDEPLAGLDPSHQTRLLRAVRALARTGSIGALVVLHDVNAAARWCDRIALVANGGLIACGPPAEVLTSANLRAVFEVDMAVLPHPLVPGRLLVVES
jgi:iron complex transport system ATP-binding protein